MKIKPARNKRNELGKNEINYLIKEYRSRFYRNVETEEDRVEYCHMYV
jgi:hypothetical protein